jgi:hypothetical protein
LGKAEQMVRSIMGPMPEPGAAAASAPPAAAGSGMGLAALDGTAAPPMSRVATAVEEASREVIEVGLDPAAGYQVRLALASTPTPTQTQTQTPTPTRCAASYLVPRALTSSTSRTRPAYASNWRARARAT